jgi:hypothetical protein
MSTISGFLLGLFVAAGLTFYFGLQFEDELGRLRGQFDIGNAKPDTPVNLEPDQRQEPAPAVGGALPESAPGGIVAAAGQASVGSLAEHESASPVAPAVAYPDLAEDDLQQRWQSYRAQSAALAPVGDFPWRSCFQRAAASYGLPESLLLAIASGESNFDPAARSDKDAVGLMQILWPQTGQHLGVRREADLYDPCTNVDAGARYLSQLAGRYDDNLHLMLAAYNYGPGRIAPGDVPEGARWYSGYIYRHLQRVLGRGAAHVADLARPGSVGTAGRHVLMRFNSVHRARDFTRYLRAQLPDLNLQRRSDTLGQHDVVLVFGSDAERDGALQAIRNAGVATPGKQSVTKRAL